MSNTLIEVTPSREDLKKLTVILDDYIIQAEGVRSGWEPDHDEFLRSYFTKPEFENKTDPWPGASNTYLPLIRVGIDGLQAQFYDSLLSQLPFVSVRGTGDNADQVSEDLSSYYGDYYFTKQMDFRAYGGNFIFDLLLDGTAVGKSRVNRDEVMRRRMQEVEGKPKRGLLGAVSNTLFGSQLPSPTQPGGQVTGLNEELYIEEKRSVTLENTSLTQIYVPPYAGESLQFPDTPWYYEKHQMTWPALLARKRRGYAIDDDLKAHLSIRQPTVDEQTKADQSGISNTDADPTIEVLEFYMRISMPAEIKHALRANRIEKLTKPLKQKFMDEDGWEEEVVVTYIPKAKRIVRIVPLDRVRADGKRPHIDGRYHRIPRSFYGSGVPESRMGLQKAINSFFNQMVDFGTLQNLPWAFFNPMTAGDLDEKMFLEPGALIPTNDPSGVTFPRFQGNPSFWISAIQMIQAWFERAESVSDFTRGIAPDRPNAPETARATMALIANAQLAFDWKSSQLSEYLLESIRHVHSLHQQYMTDEIAFEFFNKDTGAFDKRTINKKMFSEPVDFSFVLNPSRQSEQQVNQLMFTMLSPILMQVSGGDPNIIRPIAEDLWESHGKEDFNDIWPKDLPPVIQPQPGAESGPPALGQPPIPGQPGQAPPQPPTQTQDPSPQATSNDFQSNLSKSLAELAVPEGNEPVLTEEEEGFKLPKTPK